ncbi:hypothetical protein N3C_1093 [Clostridium sp. N3C]|uniref:hypothetical protein n=1 Tax=Clostridium sp. N3C TaxID=1776758 RepID=UPI00092E176A|nr:hypothetical protein [Clostridium sp. N3C]SCN23056.1 hypothetical protein N3C_1093 [Clostridium sp. N3C]
MSRKCCKEMEYKPMFLPQAYDKNCICDFPTLIILILIVLQFSKQGKKFGYDRDEDYDDCDKKYSKDNDVIGNGVLFIIALFFLSCAGCGRGRF